MNQVRTTEQRNPASMEIDRLSAIEIARLMNEEDQHVLRSVSEVLEPIARAVEAIAEPVREIVDKSDGLPEHLKDLYERSRVHLSSAQSGKLKDVLTAYQDVFSKGEVRKGL